MSFSGRYSEHDICENFNAIDQAHAAQAEADYLLAESMPGLGQFLDPVPPRRKRQRGRHDGGPKPPAAAGFPSTPSRPHRPDRP
jgi:hypothetical protein